MSRSEFEDAAAGFSFGQIDSDAPIRAAAFAEVLRLAQVNGTVAYGDLDKGFEYKGQRIRFVSRPVGIFKPRQMRRLLSIRTVFPRAGRKVWYDDQREVLGKFESGDANVNYDFTSKDADSGGNRLLREAMEEHIPIIYFIAITPTVYEVLLPTFVIGFNRVERKATIIFGDIEETGTVLPTAPERRYAIRHVRQRLHQSSFREAVIWAYRDQCAFSGLPEPRLLDAAHIVEDRHERFGQPVVRNGIALSKTYHAAFDANLIGIDPDYRIHVSPRLLSRRDGPTFEAMKHLDGQSLRRTRRDEDVPDRARLELRFSEFLDAR
jgi:putative restriction endonuclease